MRILLIAITDDETEEVIIRLKMCFGRQEGESVIHFADQQGPLEEMLIHIHFRI